MIKIRALRPGDMKQVLGLLKRYSEEENEYSVLQKLQQLYIPMHRVSQVLPLNMQFMPAIFVAVSRDHVLGLIWLSRDGAHSRRWKIDQLIMDPEAFSYDVGTQLVNYVINRYGGEGVQTFLAYVDQHYSTGLGLLKSCGFRRCTRMHYFTHTGPSALELPPPSISGLRESSNGDSGKLKSLYNDTLPPEARICLEKSWRDFYRPLNQAMSDKMKGLFCKRWVVEDAVHDVVIASIAITTVDFQNFFFDIMVSPGYDDLYQEVLTFGIQQALQNTGNARIHTEVFEFAKSGVETLETLGFHRNSIAEVLVKDYWIPIEDKGTRLQSPILLFSGKTSPAVNLEPRP